MKLLIFMYYAFIDVFIEDVMNHIILYRCTYLIWFRLLSDKIDCCSNRVKTK